MSQSRRSQNCRLARIVEASGVLANYCCDQSLVELQSLNSQESVTRSELINTINSLHDCICRLNHIVARRDALLFSVSSAQLGQDSVSY